MAPAGCSRVAILRRRLALHRFRARVPQRRRVASPPQQPGQEARVVKLRENVPLAPYTTLALGGPARASYMRSEEHTSELQSQFHLVCRLLLEKKKKNKKLM